MKSAVIGGGIAGLSAAIALKLRGIEVEVFERQKAFIEEGAGLQISPNGSRVLQALGVEVSKEFYPQSLIMRNGKTGRDIFAIMMGTNAIERWGAPYFQIHRQDLLDALLHRARDLDIPLHTNFTVDLEAYHKMEAEMEMVVVADGVHSHIRNAQFPKTKSRYSGQTAYRALIPKSALKSPPPPSAVIWAGDKQHAVTTYVKGGDVVNFVGICEEPNWEDEGWNHAVDPALVVEKFGGWHAELEAVVNAIEDAKCWALLYRPNLPNYVHGKTVFIGDAAHPMLPSFAQGAVQALEDAYILAECVHKGRLADFDRLRLKRTARVQAASRRNLERYHMSPISRTIFHNAAKLAGQFAPAVLYRELDWLYGYDVLKLRKEL